MSIKDRYRQIRSATERLCDNLEVEDFVVQTMPDVSPTKWHLAHVSWFFEKFVLEKHLPNFRCFNDAWDYLFNSYYQTAGEMHPRPRRGLLSRPTVSEILNYRNYVDEHMTALLEGEISTDLNNLVELGLNHEQQHQELLLTDIKHVFFSNPLRPALKAKGCKSTAPATEHRFVDGQAGLFQAGHAGVSFGFDNEFPSHEVLLQPHQVGSRLVTNAEFLEFIEDGGYRRPGWWLSDGWAAVQSDQWNRPLYWGEDLESEFTLAGQQDLDLQAPVVHVSLYEADAYARWRDARLPTEFEWESYALGQPVEGNLLESEFWQPRAGEGSQCFGDAWEWTSSAYAAYPGFRPLSGSLGEYNGKFMCNQLTVRGGSCVTARDHIRASYRSFFYPHQRWQFLGIRLARS